MLRTSYFRTVLTIITAIVAALIVGLLLAAIPAFADAGDLDRSFSKDGRVTTDLGGYESVADVVSQPDGKIVAGGSSRVYSGSDPALVRYNRNGSLDKTFGGGDGKVVMPDLRRDLGYGAGNLAVQPDGKIVVASGSRGFALARFNPDGTLDMTFGEDGLVTTDFGGEPEDYDRVQDLKVQPDGRIVAAGKLSDQFTLARFNPDGTPDTTFGEDGLVTTDFGGELGVKGSAASLALHPDGRIVAAGGGRGGGFGADGVAALARFNPDGTPDATLGSAEDGTVTTDFPGNSVGGINDLVLQPNGKLVVLVSQWATHGGFLSARYNLDGSLDPSFGGDGVVNTKFRGLSTSASTSLVLQSDGKIVAAGDAIDANSGSESVFVLWRYNRNGTLDRSFGGGDGVLTTNFGKENTTQGAHLTLQPNGKIVAAGSTVYRASNQDFALARYNTE